MGTASGPGGRDGLAATLAEARESLLGSAHDLGALTDEQRLEILHQIELLGRAAAGVGARLQTAFRSSQVQAQRADGVRPSRAGLAVGDDLALARLISPYWGRRELTSVRALVEQMPRTLTALGEGTISPHQARQVTELTTCLSQEDRDEVDARLVDVLPGIARASWCGPSEPWSTRLTPAASSPARARPPRTAVSRCGRRRT